MRRYLIIILLALLCIPTALADHTFTDEALHYKVEYKWGLINKTAGYVTMSLRNRSDKYSCLLIASSAPWADKVYSVRDTLKCDILKKGFLPVYYEKLAHEDNEFRHETVKYSRSGSTVTANCTRKKYKKGKLTADEPKVLTAEGHALDMLSAFYYMRSLPYQTWTAGHTESSTIFSGKKKETLTIKYAGEETIKVDKKDYMCYHIKFTFTSKGGKKSSDDIDAWISTADRIPIKLEGSLPIGKIRCFYTGK